MSKTEFGAIENKFPGHVQRRSFDQIKPEFKLAPDFWFYMFAFQSFWFADW